MLGQTGEIDLPEDDVLRVYQETGNGVLPVDITVKKGSPTRVVMTQSLPQFGESVPTNMPLGEALGGDHATVPTEPAPQVVSDRASPAHRPRALTGSVTVTSEWWTGSNARRAPARAGYRLRHVLRSGDRVA